MALIKNGQKVTDDAFILLNEDAQINDQAAILLPLARYTAAVEDGSLSGFTGKVGIVLAPADDTRASVAHFDNIDLIAIDFPAYKDGRGFTHARLLREQLGWTGEIRAIGDVLYDQLQYMLRVGIDAFDVRKDYDADNFAKATAVFTDGYQAAPAARTSVIEKRHALG